jgi:hypothetical protein
MQHHRDAFVALGRWATSPTGCIARWEGADAAVPPKAGQVGLAAHRALGRALVAVSDYRLVIGAGLMGEDGRTVGATRQVPLRIGPAKTRGLDPARWCWTPPHTSSIARPRGYLARRGHQDHRRAGGALVRCDTPQGSPVA